MSDEPKTIAQFIEEQKVTMTCNPTNDNPSMDPAAAADMKHWKCTIAVAAQNTRVYVTFSLGSGHGGKEPEVDEVLDCLASDASSMDGVVAFEEWAENLGYDTDSRNAERTFNTTRDQTASLKRTLGDEAFRELVEDIERL